MKTPPTYEEGLQAGAGIVIDCLQQVLGPKVTMTVLQALQLVWARRLEKISSRPAPKTRKRKRKS